MFFWKKNKAKQDSTQPKVQDKLAKGIAGFLFSVQNRFASFMNSQAGKLSTNAKQFWLIAFCLVFGGFSIYAFLGAFSDSKSSSQSMKPALLSVPKYYDRTGTEFPESLVTERDIARINRFKKYMDSLSHSAKGRIGYDSILKAKPGLIDSIKALEKSIIQQSK